MRHLCTWGGIMHFILISNERCISHKLFAQYVWPRFSLTQSFDSTPLPVGDCRGPSVPTLISSTLAVERKTGTPAMSGSDRTSGTTRVCCRNNTRFCLEIQSEHSIKFIAILCFMFFMFLFQ